MTRKKTKLTKEQQLIADMASELMRYGMSKDTALGAAIQAVRGK